MIDSMPRLLINLNAILVNRALKPKPNLLTIYHDDTPHYYWPTVAQNMK